MYNDILCTYFERKIIMDYQLINNLKKAIQPLQEIERHSNLIKPIQTQINELKNDTAPKHNIIFDYLIAFLLADIIVFYPLVGVTKNFYVSLITGLISTVILGTLIFIIRKAGDKRRVVKHAEMINNKISKLNQEILVHTDEISKIYNEYFNIFSLIPPDYRESGKVTHLCSILENQRADTLKEALNVFEEDMHRQAMQAGQRQIMNQQMQLEQRVRYAEEMAYQAQQLAEQAYYYN